VLASQDTDAESTARPGGDSHRVAVSGDVEVSTYLEIGGARAGAADGTTAERRTTAATAPPEPPTPRDAIAILDFGSQYSQLIARRVRESQVYCELLPHDVDEVRVRALNPRGFILSGGPASVYAEDAPKLPPFLLGLNRPILGICYGMQLMAHELGGAVAASDKREYGHALVSADAPVSPLFADLPEDFPVWMSHADAITELPAGFRAIAHSDNSPVAAMGNERGWIGLQFHPEVAHTPNGKQLLANFLFKVCGCQPTWTPGSYVDEAVADIRRQVGAGKVICALSGGVDSAVAATLIHRAVGDQLTCIFVNNGLLRRDEAERSLTAFERHLHLNVVYVDATDRFLTRLADVTDPEQKRQIIGDEFIHVFADEARPLGKIDFLAQGTLYPDVIESKTSDTKAAARIKTHHNVGGLPDWLPFRLVEPLRYLFKDEVRQVGAALGLPDDVLWRQPFPGPGLAIRILGEVTAERLDMLRAADWIVVNEIKKAGMYHRVWQSFAVLTPLRTVGVMGDGRTYANVVAVRIVQSDDGMTADWARVPYDLLARISTRIVNEVPGVNRVVYDISSKPPSTIEWE
jgi:GMP synthase (glutamine-hydrolysing)